MIKKHVKIEIHRIYQKKFSIFYVIQHDFPYILGLLLYSTCTKIIQKHFYFKEKIFKCLSQCKRWRIKCLISVSRDRYIIHFYCIAIEAGLCSDMVGRLPYDPAAWPFNSHLRQFGFSASCDIWYCCRAKIFQPGQGLWIYRQTFYQVVVKASFYHNAVKVYYIHVLMTSGRTKYFKIFCIWNLRLFKIISIILSWSNLYGWWKRSTWGKRCLTYLQAEYWLYHLWTKLYTQTTMVGGLMIQSQRSYSPTPPQPLNFIYT